MYPYFFLFPLAKGEYLGVQVYGEGRTHRKQYNLHIGNWKDEKWPPECVIQYYSIATWTEDESCCHTPIYMLNLIIRLQKIVKIITN